MGQQDGRAVVVTRRGASGIGAATVPLSSRPGRASCCALWTSPAAWGSDFPHIDSALDAPMLIRGPVGDLPADRRRRVLGDDARLAFPH